MADNSEIFRFLKLPRNHWEDRLRHIPDKSPHKKRLKEILESMENVILTGRSFYFHGIYSKGKSGCASMLLKQAAGLNYFGLWINYDELPDYMAGDNRNPIMSSPSVTMRERIMNTDLLVVDEFKLDKNREWLVSLLDRIVRKRTQLGLNTVITTNVSPEVLAQKQYCLSLLAIMQENFELIYVDGKDFRAGKTP